MDFDAIKRKLAKLNKNNNAKSMTWKPTGEHTIRIVPTEGGDPFIERKFYYFLQKGSVLAPGPSFGHPDPIQELRDKLYEDGTDASKEQAWQLAPKMRVYVPVIVRGEEQLGVRWWGFGKKMYEQILSIILDEDYGDITSVKNGHDIKVSHVQETASGFPETKIVVRPKPSVLSENTEKIELWTNNIPDFNEIFQEPTYEELEKYLNEWLSSANASSEKDDSTDTAENTEVKSDSNSVDTAFDVLKANVSEESSKLTESIDAAFEQLNTE